MVWAIAALAGVGALFASAAPTGLIVVDAFWRVGAAVLLTLATARARRWPAVWVAGLPATLATGWALAASGAAFACAAVGMFTSQRNRVAGAAAGALATQALLRLPEIGPQGFTSLFAAIAVAPVLVSGYRCSHRSTRRVVRLAVLVGGIILTVAVIGAAYAAAVAYGDVRRAVSETREGRDLLRETELERATVRFDQAATDFDDAATALTRPWTLPGRAVPILAQHLDALTDASRAGASVTESAAEVSSTAPYQDLRANNGEVNVELVRQMQAPVASSVGVMQDAYEQLESVSTSWLAAPVTEQLEEFIAELDETLPEAELAAEALDLAPSLLGADGSKTYLMLFTSPAETRFLGGFAGSWGLLEAENGNVTFEESGSIGELNRMGDPDLRVLPDFPGRDAYEARYARFHPTRFFQNVTVSPDLETNATVARDLFRQVTGMTVDGVIVADPFALAAFLELTGPVEVEELGRTFDAGNVVDYLLTEQYLEFEDDTQERRDRLQDVADATFEALTSRELPAPGRVGRALGPVVEQKHLMVWMFDERDQQLFERFEAEGSFEVPENADFVALRTANGNANKIDTYLRRSLAYDVTYDPETGTTSATATVSLTNDAPPGGLPRYIIGNTSGEPEGSNIVYLSLYTPLELRSLQVNAEFGGASQQEELGSNVYSTLVTVPPQATVRVAFDLHGVLPLGASYRLGSSPQPVVHPDRMSLVVSSGSRAWQVGDPQTYQIDPEDLEVEDGRATWEGPLLTDMRWLVPFESAR